MKTLSVDGKGKTYLASNNLDSIDCHDYCTLNFTFSMFTHCGENYMI